jgi:hypothetical protein
VHRLEPLVAALSRKVLGLLDGFLAFERELVKSKGHGIQLLAAIRPAKCLPRMAAIDRTDPTARIDPTGQLCAPAELW